MSTTEQGTDYELFVQGIYTTLMKAEDVENITVQHNIDLAGKSGCNHQIDVYWEFKVAGQVYRTAIECKSYNSPVNIGRVRDFYGVLADIPGLQGIVVSLFGFQSGARKYAEHYGIRLQEIREPTSEDWEGRIKTIQVNLIIIEPKIKELKANVTPAFLATLPKDKPIGFQFAGLNHGSFIVDADGKHVASHEEIRTSVPHKSYAETDLEVTKLYPNCFMVTTDGNIPIDSVTVRYDVDVAIDKIEIRGEEIAKAIMKDVATGEIKFFAKDGRIA